MFFVASILGTSGCGKDQPPAPPAPPPLPAVKVQMLQISRHVTTSLDETRADLILQDASAVLQVKDGPEDMVCPVALHRTGGVAVFTTGNGAINSEADYRAILALPGQVKVVNQINWCQAFAPNIIGCSPTPGNTLIVVRHRPDEEGILWDHEYGHNKGLMHRNDPTAVMNESVAVDHRAVNETECAAYEK